MVVIHGRSRRKPTGGRYKKSFRSKRKFQQGSHPTMTQVGDRKTRTSRGLGGSITHFLLAEKVVNVMDPKTHKAKKVAIKGVTENAANRNFVRRNILTKGTVIETELGKAKITSRPGQEGAINAVLM